MESRASIVINGIGLVAFSILIALMIGAFQCIPELTLFVLGGFMMAVLAAIYFLAFIGYLYYLRRYFKRKEQDFNNNLNQE